jgi:hypothetical protein
MNMLTLGESGSFPCPFWPCKLNGIASLIIVAAAIKYVIQLLVLLVQYVRKSKTGGSNQLGR